MRYGYCGQARAQGMENGLIVIVTHLSRHWRDLYPTTEVGRVEQSTVKRLGGRPPALAYEFVQFFHSESRHHRGGGGKKNKKQTNNHSRYLARR